MIIMPMLKTDSGSFRGYRVIQVR